MKVRLLGLMLAGVMIFSCGTFNAFQSLTDKQVRHLSSKAKGKKKDAAKPEALTPAQVNAILERVKKTPVEKVKEHEVAVLQTSMGPIVIAFYTDVAPEHCKNFKRLVKAGYFDQTRFHRIIDGFMIQGGDILTRDQDPNNDGMGGPGYMINAEFNDKQHDLGILSMARSQDPNSAGSQFFICLSRAGTQRLDGKYTVFGQVIGGLETVQKLGKVETLVNRMGEKSMPATPVYIERAVMVKR
jgi:peptidyl-prolyl cis-trans isomerase B (cyclophilin B)